MEAAQPQPEARAALRHEPLIIFELPLRRENYLNFSAGTCPRPQKGHPFEKMTGGGSRYCRVRHAAVLPLRMAQDVCRDVPPSLLWFASERGLEAIVEA
jgi:hypothetical protein